MKSIVLCLVALLVLPGTALAFTCRGNIISEEDQVDIVTAKCGEPTSRRVSKQEVTGTYGGTSSYQGGGRATQEGSYKGVVVQIETLVYNCGEGRLIHVLTFKDGKLQKVDTAGHGSGPRICD